jgi:hypothetical protein
MDLRNTLMSKTLSRELKLNFHQRPGDFTTEIRLETFQHQEPTETSIKTRSNSLLFQDSVFWVNGSATGKSDTTSQLKDTCTKVKETASNWTTLILNTLCKKSLLKIMNSR